MKVLICLLICQFLFLLAYNQIISPNGNVSFCASGNLTVTGITGTPTYQWQKDNIDISGATASSLLVTVSGSYTVIISNPTQVKPALVVVTINQNPVVKVNSQVICNKQSATLTASGADNYTWSPNNGLNYTTGSTVTATTATTTTYTVTGKKNINGCFTVAEAVVTVNPLPVASFNFSPTNGCPLRKRKVFFINTSTNNSGISTYQWNFGDPNSGNNNFSQDQDPNHSFVGVAGGAPQKFTIQLIATNNYGCKDTTTQEISFGQFPDATLNDNSSLISFRNCGAGNFNLTVVNSSATRSNNILYEITWGDGSIPYSNLTMETVAHTYSSQGYFTILFVVTGSGGCKDSSEYVVYNGSNPGVGLSSNGSTVLQCLPATDTFFISNTATNPPGTSYTVSFNDGSPNLVFTHPAPPYFVHTFTKSSCGASGGITPNTFYVRVKAENPCGFLNGSVEPITTITQPTANFSISPDSSICINKPMTFTNKSINGTVVQNNGDCDNRSVSNWVITAITGSPNAWTLNSGSFGNSDPNYNIPNQWGTPQLDVTFTAEGTYSMMLVVKNFSPIGNSCRLDTIIKRICVQGVPIPSFTTSSFIGCTPYKVNLKNTSSRLPTCGIISQSWIVTKNTSACSITSANNYAFVDGTSANSNNPSIQFNDQGVYTVILSITSKCGTFNTAPSTITIKSKPQFSINALPTICAGGYISPSANISSCGGTVSAYAWSFPGGSPSSSTLENPGQITYSTAGNYIANLSVTNECGTTIAPSSITVNPPPTLGALQNQTICNGSSTAAINFSGTATSFAWTNNTTSIGLPASGTGNIASFISINKGNFPITATINVTPISTLCNGTPTTFSITVNPAATVIFSSAAQTICSGESTIAISLSSATSGANFTWNASQPAGIGGVNINGTTTIPAQTIINSTNAPVTVQYIATATTNGNATCPGSSFT